MEPLLPQGFYLNDWTTIDKRAEAQFHASPDEIRTATHLREKGSSGRLIKEHLFRLILLKDSDGLKSLMGTANRSLLERHSPEGLTPLALSCAVGDEACVTALLDLGANVFARDSIGATPLIHSSFRGHSHIVKQLLESKAGGKSGREMMMRQFTTHGETAVHAAAKGGHPEVLQILADAGCETGLTCSMGDVSGVDALMLAAAHNQPSSVNWLLGRGLLPSRRDEAGRDSLMHACLKGAKEAAQALLSPSVQPPLDVGSKDLNGFGYFALACTGGNLELVELFLARDSLAQKLLSADVTAASVSEEERGASILCAVAEKGHANVLEFLLKNKIAGSNQLMIGGPNSPMFKAVKSDKASSVDVLLVHGARIDCRDQKGRTPLHWCAVHDKKAMAKLLVARGASLVAVDNDGKVPRQLAHKHHHHELSTSLSSMAHTRYFGHCHCYLCEPGGTGPEIHDQIGRGEDDSAVLSVTRHQRLLHGDVGEGEKRRNHAFAAGDGDLRASADKVKLWPSPLPSGGNYLSSFYTQGRAEGHQVWGNGSQGPEAYDEGLKGQRADQYYTWPYDKKRVEHCCLASGGRNNFRNRNAPIVWLPMFRD